MDTQRKQPKYSIIIPSKNGGLYLPSCVDTIIKQEYSNYELIISDDHSTDSTVDFIKNLSHPRLRCITPPVGLSMAEHWEWALGFASGEWLIFVGQDDGLQPYFFMLAEKLTAIAKRKNIRTIMSARAYYFWPGCQDYYGNTAIAYSAENRITTHNCLKEVFLTILGMQAYFELPEMYTTSLFHNSIINEAKKLQEGELFVTHPQDANLAAIACSLERHYIRSSIPLGWVGSSIKSAGLAVSDGTHGDLLSLKNEYIDNTTRSNLRYNKSIGDFSIGAVSLYFYGALLETTKLRNIILNFLIKSKICKKVVFSVALTEIERSKKNILINRRASFNKCITDNGFSISEIESFSRMQLKSIQIIVNISRIPSKGIKKLGNAILGLLKKPRKIISLNCNVQRHEGSFQNLITAQDIIRRKFNETKILKYLR